MGRTLCLELPESDRTPAVINAYYDHVITKYDGTHPSTVEERLQRLDQSHRERAIEKLGSDECYILSSYVPRECAATSQWDRLTAIFEPTSGDIIRTVDDPDELDELITIF